MANSGRKSPSKSQSTEDSPSESARIYPFQSKERSKAAEPHSARSECIQVCWETYRLLALTATRLSERRNHLRQGELALLWDGAQAAQCTAEFLIRNSPSALLIASTCAEVCDDIADELETRHEDEDSPDSALLLDCAERARSLADACDGLADAEAFEEPPLSEETETGGDSTEDEAASG
jgi:hypothetical protein